MFSKSSISILMALTISMYAGGATRANESSAKDANTSWQAADAETPASPDYKNRVIRTSPDSKTEWQKLESDNPHSVNFGKRSNGSSKDPNAAWDESESENPHTARTAGK